MKREWVKAGAFLAMPALCNIDEGMEQSDVRKVLITPDSIMPGLMKFPSLRIAACRLSVCALWIWSLKGKLQAEQLEDIGKLSPARRLAAKTIAKSIHHVCRWYAGGRCGLGHGVVSQRTGKRHWRQTQPVGITGFKLNHSLIEKTS
ncbi:hypothetical protein LZ023_38990 (plasmid) [Pseudomonas silvicola]|nr:hypothetical protein LZ023_38990 [Pseudomonas silvicola]